MHTRRKHRLVGIALGALLAAFTLGSSGCSDAQGLESPLDASVAGGDQEALSGTWVLNRDLSDKPDHARPQDRPGPDGQRPERPGRFGGEPPNIGEADRPEPPVGRHGMGRGGPRGLPEQLEISQSGVAVTFAGPGERSHTLYTDGRVESHELPNGDEVEVQAEWTGGALVVVRNSARGTHTETFTLTNDAQQLTVTVRMEGTQLPEAREFKRVYDRSG